MAFSGEKIGNFSWEDPFLLTEQLNEEERLISGTARAFAREKLMPRIVDAFAEETVEPDIFREMGEQGLLGATVAPEFGGAGASYVSYGLIAREIEAVDSGYRSMMSVQSSLVIHPINTFGSQEQKEKYLPTTSGEWIGCFGLTEPDAGSDPAGMDIRKKVDGGFAERIKDMDIQRTGCRCVCYLAKSDAHDGKSRVHSRKRHGRADSPKIEGKCRCVHR